VKVQRDVAIGMRDGVRHFANVFRPDDGAAHPVVLSVTPYCKDNAPDRLGMFVMRLSGVRFGQLNCSRRTGFESPDPVFGFARAITSSKPMCGECINPRDMQVR
jgi:uncharacterized protein